MAVGSNIFETDYVYNAEHSGEYRNVHVEVTIGEDAAVILLAPLFDMTDAELTGVLHNIENDVLKKTRITLLNECRVVLTSGGQAYTVSLTGHPPQVVGKERLQA